MNATSLEGMAALLMSMDKRLKALSNERDRLMRDIRESVLIGETRVGNIKIKKFSVCGYLVPEHRVGRSTRIKITKG